MSTEHCKSFFFRSGSKKACFFELNDCSKSFYDAAEQEKSFYSGEQIRKLNTVASMVAKIVIDALKFF